MFTLIFFLRKGRGGEEFFLEICGKNGVLVENGQEGYQNVTQRFQRDFLREDMYFRKIFPIKKSFQTFSIILVFCRFFEGLSKRPPRVQMKLLRKSFFEQKIVNDFFSEFEQSIVILWQHNFNRLSKLRSICLDYFFHGVFFTLKLLNSWITFSGNRADLFCKIFEKQFVLLLKSFSLIVKSGLHKSGGFFQRKLSFFGWMN